jgi:hypothetical protein
MEVTQVQIDDAIGLANETIAILGIKSAETLLTGCQPCEDVFTDYNKTIMYKFILGQGLDAVSSGCLQMMDLWRVIQEVNTMSSCNPLVVIDNFNWLITNTGIPIITNEYKKIIVT